MKRRQCNKPDFLKDLDNQILDGLAAGDRKGDVAAVVGCLQDIAERADGSRQFTVHTPRLRSSKVMDEVIVIASKEAGGSFASDDCGKLVMVTGSVETHKDAETGRVAVYVAADFMALAPKGEPQDEVVVCGEIAREPIHRTTPLGKRITDIIVKKPKAAGGYSFVPCICWQETADEVAGWQQGDKVELLGRYQSREYTKVTDTDSGASEKRTAYEVSVRHIRRAGAENEK